MFEHLKSIYENANKLQNVKSDYHKLIMHNENNYHEFVTKFLHLTEEVKIVRRDYKTDFNDKLFFDLQKMKSKSSQKNESNIFKQNTLQTVNSQTLLSISTTKSSTVKKVLSFHSDIQCYYCKKKDHIARNCSAKQKSQQMIAELTENDASESSADSEKE
ncbi:hypothetical protein PAAG_12681 [Paracoccidioides lutzii Pb01]|uniref:CCHC-type domain-containing protein n=1 Tax=Paracoccidioides lutzii (strain ATCC MYA-826 / Pb01) TaxID=502779 RepID=A0A0A2UZL5_PARBA|nr:hypothetical protein PAAG_12681 [Paracoccidioides lutzii Pb01]KGQ00658.1 hypothetical protein PAAG_12681 [Paracoccidioides lutzii Pb01]